MSDSIADNLRFPETPQEMSEMLLLEARIKRERGLTHRGMNGYLIYEMELTQSPMMVPEAELIEHKV